MAKKYTVEFTRNAVYQEKGYIIIEASTKAEARQLAKEALENHGSIIVRKSGTEPVLRLKIEDENQELVTEISEKILACIKKLS